MGHGPGRSVRVFAALAVLILSGCVTPAPPAGPFTLSRTRFAALAGWAAGDPRPALAAFRRSCAVWAQKTADTPLGGAGYAGTVGDWAPVCAAAANVTDDPAAARGFFAGHFVPYRVGQGADTAGLFTGYFEPELKGSLTRHGPYQTPLYGRPSDLVSVNLGRFRPALKGQRLAGKVEDGTLVPYATRAEIARDGLSAAPILAYVASPVDAFFLQVQGSGRLLLDDGSAMRISYAAQNGYPYTAIGAVLVERGVMTRDQVSLQSIQAWLMDHPDQAQDLLDTNQSYVFFSLAPLDDPALGAKGSEGVPLTPGASLAVDPALNALGVPIWLEATAPDAAGKEAPLDRLLVAQDTGGAIKGAVRGDVYWGFGPEAGAIAGQMRSMGTMTVLLPAALATRLGDHAQFPGAGA